MTVRNVAHSTTESKIAFLLWAWLRSKPEPRGKVASGEAGFLLKRNPDTTVGIDVAYVPPNMKVRKLKRRTLFDGPPILAVEILSPTDQTETIQNKIRKYLRHGIRVVWVVDTADQTVVVHSKGQRKQFFQTGDVLVGDPHLPGFTCPVAEFFR